MAFGDSFKKMRQFNHFYLVVHCTGRQSAQSKVAKNNLESHFTETQIPLNKIGVVKNSGEKIAI